MVLGRYSSWPIGKRWRKNRKNKDKNSDANLSKSDNSNGNNDDPSATRISWASSAGNTADTVSLSGSVSSEYNNSHAHLMSSNSSISTSITLEEQLQWEQQMKKQKEQFSAFVDRVDESDKKGKKSKERTEPEAAPMPRITEEYDLSFNHNDDYDIEEYEDVYDEDDSESEYDYEDEDDDIDISNVGNDHQCEGERHYQVAPANPLPQSRELSRELCRIVFGMGVNPVGKRRRRALSSLLKVSGWVDTNDQAFLKDFLTYGGLAKILDFLEDLVVETQDGLESHSESSESEDGKRYQQQHGGPELLQLRITIESIRSVARMLSGLCRKDKEETRISAIQQRINTSRHGHPSSPGTYQENLTEATATVVVNHGGIESLLRASDVCCQFYKNNRAYRNEVISASATFDGEALSLIEATEEVWTAIANTCTSADDETATKIVDNVSVSIWDAGLAAMETFGAGIGFGGFDGDKDSGNSHSAVAAAAAPPGVAVLLLNTSVFRAFETILVRRRGDPLVTRNLFAEKKVLSRLVKLVPGAKRISPTMNIELNINGSSRTTASLHSSLHSNINGSAHSDTLHSSIHSCSIHNCELGESAYEEEAFLMEEALCFFYECHTQELLFEKKNTRRKVKRSNFSDERWFPREGMIPMCVAGLEKFGSESSTIRRKALRILDAAIESCSNNDSNKEDDRRQIILAELIEGAIKALAACLISDRINETEKDKFRAVIRKIANLESDGDKRDETIQKH